MTSTCREKGTNIFGDQKSKLKINQNEYRHRLKQHDLGHRTGQIFRQKSQVSYGIQLDTLDFIVLTVATRLTPTFRRATIVSRAEANTNRQFFEWFFSVLPVPRASLGCPVATYSDRPGYSGRARHPRGPVFFVWDSTGLLSTIYSVQQTCPPLTEFNQCAFASDSYLFYSSPDIWNVLFRTFVLRTKSRSTSIFVSFTVLPVGETFIITDQKSVLFLLISLSAGHSRIRWFAVRSSSSQRSQVASFRFTFGNVIPEGSMTGH